MENLFIKFPNKGDIVVGELSTGKVKFIKLDTFNNNTLSTTAYERIGVVGRRTGNDVLIIYKENASQKYCNRAWWYLSGYTLDGTDRTGTLSLRFASNSWNANIDKVISYNATTTQGLVDALNAFFISDTDCVAQDWYADIVDDKVRIHCDNIDYRQCSSNSAKNGFTLTGSLPEIKYVANMRRKHGGIGGEGACSNVARMARYFRDDLDSNSYNPTSALTNIKTSYPVCLPAYLGTSAYRDGDKCKILREFYGEGEEGWMRYLEAQRPLVPTDYGNMGIKNGLELTKVLASMKFTSSKVAAQTAMCSAADYCYQRSTTCIPQGNWYLPQTEDLYHILDGLQYGTNSSRNSDPVNEGLYKIGGTAISNGSSMWSCSRYVTGNAWVAYGSVGYFTSGYMYYTYVCVPVCSIKVA